MASSSERAGRVTRRIEAAWADLRDSCAGLTDGELAEPGAAGAWSVKDVLAHVTTWEEEALRYLPLIAEGGRPPRYASSGGIDAFNGMMRDRKRSLSPAEVLAQADEVHGRLLDLIRRAPDDHLASGSRFRRRLRLDTYAHYREHAEAIRGWRKQRR